MINNEDGYYVETLTCKIGADLRVRPFFYLSHVLPHCHSKPLLNVIARRAFFARRSNLTARMSLRGSPASLLPCFLPCLRPALLAKQARQQAMAPLA